MNRQLDLFPTTAAIDAPPALDPESMRARVRPRLAALLAEARAAAENPWTAERTRVHAHIFHNMANWLPAAERDALRAAFVAELIRLGAGEAAANAARWHPDRMNPGATGSRAERPREDTRMEAD